MLEHAVNDESALAGGYLFVAKCSDGSLYIGFGGNLENSLRDINLGRGAVWSRKKRPVTLLRSWPFESRLASLRASDAARRLPDDQKQALIEGRLNPYKLPLKQVNTWRDVVCERCGKNRRTRNVNRDVCDPCYKKEPKSQCSRCHRVRHDIVHNSGLCGRCFSQPESVCANCSDIHFIVNQDFKLCKKCHQKLRSKLLPKVECSRCGEVKTPSSAKRPICKRCAAWSIRSISECGQCHVKKPLRSKSKNLCRLCYNNFLAPKSLRKYTETYSSPYTYNNHIFGLLASSIDWDSVTEFENRRLRVFGRFLLNKQLDKPLTWDVIYDALPPLKGSRGLNLKLIRSCLFACGHILAAKGEIESQYDYTLRRYALMPISRAPAYAQNILSRFVRWLEEKLVKPVSIRDHMEAVTSFWSWCDQRGIKLPEGVRVADFNNYLVTLSVQWECVICGDKAALDPLDRIPPQTCNRCSAICSFIETKRYAIETIRKECGKLRVFFDWARINHLVIANPIKHKIKPLAPTIRHYPLGVIEKLAAKIADPELDPTEALALYLIIFHAYSIWELQHAQIPTAVPADKSVSRPTIADASYLIVPKPAPSRGKHTPGRPETRVDFAPEAEWCLRPLLKRYEEQRRLRAKNQNNLYVFITGRSGLYNKPVNHEYIKNIVHRASVKILGARVSPGMLRKTSGIIFTECGSASDLREMGWSREQGLAYEWHQRIVVNPNSSKAVVAGRE